MVLYCTDMVEAKGSRMPGVAAVIVAAGRGERAGSGIPKQYRLLAGQPVLARSIAALAQAPGIDAVLCVIGRDPDHGLHYRQAIQGLCAAARAKLLPPCPGGPTRQTSVLAGLCALADGDHTPAVVLVHDAARPLVSHPLVERAVAAARAHGAAVPGLAVTDTLKLIDAKGQVQATLDRASLRAVQTPQAFAFGPLLAAHRRALEAGMTHLTDDAAVLEWAGETVHVFEGEARNIKLTAEADFSAAERWLRGPLTTRVGFGFDVHALGPGDRVRLGGVDIAHTASLIGHSDADVVLHAVTDAILGALADGDIGVHFPPTDMRWRGVSSDRFVAFAIERLRAQGGILDHLDVTLLCEAPRIGPHRDAMIASLARICGISAAQVGLKATTAEGLGFVGRREGIAAQAVATLRLPAGEVQDVR
jgi:2-C-methyl-D-erythritol 4-phosphate cytidylyltransferase / 2-C-methyl-D-erythritol 2,4-cyclodiphosphate synthase